jgi:hypothetical protein
VRNVSTNKVIHTFEWCAVLQRHVQRPGARWPSGRGTVRPRRCVYAGAQIYWHKQALSFLARTARRPASKRPSGLAGRCSSICAERKDPGHYDHGARALEVVRVLLQLGWRAFGAVPASQQLTLGSWAASEIEHDLNPAHGATHCHLRDPTQVLWPFNIESR